MLYLKLTAEVLSQVNNNASIIRHPDLNWESMVPVVRNINAILKADGLKPVYSGALDTKGFLIFRVSHDELLRLESRVHAIEQLAREVTKRAFDADSWSINKPLKALRARLDELEAGTPFTIPTDP